MHEDGLEVMMSALVVVGHVVHIDDLYILLGLAEVFNVAEYAYGGPRQTLLIARRCAGGVIVP
jgi:hypothetical protein